MLNKRERNRLYQLIAESEFDPTEFDLDDESDKSTVTHNSGSVFEFSLRARNDNLLKEFGIDDISYEYKFSVVEGNSETGSSSSIRLVSTLYIPAWLKEIRLTVGVPDYWDEMKRGQQLLAKIQKDSANTPFTQDEQRQIAAQLQEIKKQVREQFALTSEQRAQVGEKLDEVAEASTRMGRKDWLIYFLGTITALIITATVTAGVGEHIFTIVIQGIAHLFTGGSEPPQIPPGILA